MTDNRKRVSLRRQIVLPPDLDKQIAVAAAQRGLNKSAFIRRGMRSYLNLLDGAAKRAEATQ